MKRKLIIWGLVLAIVMSLVGCRSKEDKITTLSMLGGGKTFAVPTGSVADKYVLAKFPDAKIMYYNDAVDCAMAVKGQQADVAVYDKPILQNIAAKNKGLAVLPELLCNDNYGFAVNLNNRDLKKTIDTVVSELKADGTYDDMIKRWFPEKGEPSPMPKLMLTGTKGTLKFGTNAEAEPLSFVDSSQKPIGMDIEIATYVAKKLDMQIEVINMDFEGMIPSLVAGKVDMIGAGLSITEERGKAVLFSESYYSSGIAALVYDDTQMTGKKDNSAGAKLNTVDDLNDKRIGVLLGSVQDGYATSTYPAATILQYKSPSDVILAVKTGKVDAAFFSYETLLERLRNDNELAVLSEKVFTVPIGMGFKQENDSLREQFNIFLKQTKDKGIFEDMVNRWIVKGSTEMPVIEHPKTNGTLVVGTVSDKGLPFTIVKDNKLIGFDIELAERFAAYLGKELKLEDMEFGSLISAVATHKIDMITSTLMITEERKRQIDFSDPYYELNMSVFALKKNLEPANSNKLNTLDDIANKRVAVFTGTVHDAFVVKKYPQAKVLRYESPGDMVMSIKSDKTDVAMLDLLSANVVIKDNPEIGILSENVFTLPLGVGFNKNNPSLRDKFNGFLKAARADGTYDKMYQRWFVDDPEKAVMPAIDTTNGSQKIRLGVSVADLPYVAMLNGQYAGFDIEMIKRFAASDGNQLEIIPMEFSSLIAALASGKVDIITDGISITEERSKQIDFSDAYMDSKTAVVALKKNLANNTEQPEEALSVPWLKSISDSFYNNIILEQRYLLILDGLKTTIIISVFAALFGTVLGALICLMRMAKRKLLSTTAKLYISLLRGTPILVLLMLIYYVVFSSININPVFVAVFAFGLNFAAYVSEMFRTSIESIDKGQEEAGIAGGFTKIQTFLYIIMPQALRQALPVYKGEFISLLKMTSVVGYIAVQDLTKASDIIRSRTFDAFFPLIMAAVLYLVMAWLLTLALSRIEISIDPKRKRKGGAIQ